LDHPFERKYSMFNNYLNPGERKELMFDKSRGTGRPSLVEYEGLRGPEGLELDCRGVGWDDARGIRAAESASASNAYESEADLDVVIGGSG
jgi:hypothetical protein